jgi:hypothetical protein
MRIVARGNAALYPDMGSHGGFVRIILHVLALAFCPLSAMAESVAATIEKFGLMGIWAIDCTAQITATQPGFRLIITEPQGGASSYTTTSSDGSDEMTIRSTILAATPLEERRLKLRLRIVGGDHNGGLLPSPTTNTVEEVIEILGGTRVRIMGGASQILQRCRD